MPFAGSLQVSVVSLRLGACFLNVLTMFAFSVFCRYVRRGSAAPEAAPAATAKTRTSGSSDRTAGHGSRLLDACFLIRADERRARVSRAVRQAAGGTTPVACRLRRAGRRGRGAHEARHEARGPRVDAPRSVPADRPGA